MSRQGSITKQKLKLHLEVEKTWMEVTFLRLTDCQWGFMGSGHVREGFALPLPSDSPPSVSATEILKGPNCFAVFFFFV